MKEKKAQFLRTELLFGKNSIEKFESYRVAIIGLGGVGTYTAESLVRSGICNFRLVDFDKIKLSNINRQLPALHSTLNRFKADVMKERMLDINPNANIEVITTFCGDESKDYILDGIDFVVDAIDSLTPKAGLIEEVYNRKIKLISIMGAGGKIDPSKIELCDLSETRNCRLAKQLRKYLRNRGITTGIPVVNSFETIYVKQLDYKDGSEEEWELERGRKRGTLGSVGYLPAIMGLWAASYVLRNIAINFEI